MNVTKASIVGAAAGLPLVDNIIGLVTNPVGLLFRAAVGAAVVYGLIPVVAGLKRKNRW